MKLLYWLGAVLFAVGAISGTSLFSKSESASGAKASECMNSGESEYLSPIGRMPPVRSAPARPPFGPRALSMQSLNPLRVGSGVIGLSFSNLAHGQRLKLNWSIVARLNRVDGRGRLDAHDPILNRRVKIGTLSSGARQVVGFKVSGKPSYFRIDFELRDEEDSVLARYGEYFRVVRSVYSAEVWLDAPEVSPDEVLSASLRNLGTESVWLDSQMEMQRLLGSEWSQIGVASVGRIRPGFKVVVPGGASAECAKFRIPVGQPAGTYRIAAQVRHDGVNDAVSAKFQVK